MRRDEQKRIAAAAAAVVVVAGMGIAIVKMNQAPQQIVDEAEAGVSQSLLAMEELEASEDPIAESIRELPGEAITQSTEKVEHEAMTLPERVQEEAEPSSTEHKKTTLVVRTNEEGESEIVEVPVEETESTQPSEDKGEGTEHASETQAPSQEKAPSTESTASAEDSAEEAASSVPPSDGETEDAPASSTTPPLKDATQGDPSKAEGESEAEGDAPSDDDASETPTEGKTQRVDTPVAKQLNDADPYDKQAMGNSFVTFYAHPSLTVGLDFRRHPEVAQQIYVSAPSDGFVILPRMALSLSGTSPEDVKERVEKGETLPGMVRVKRIKKEEQEKLQSEIPEAIFVEDGREFSYAVYKEKETPETAKMAKALPTIDVELIADNLSTSGLIGKPSPSTAKTFEEQEKTWLTMVQSFEKDPAQAEQKWGLPLLSPSESYVVEGEDVRANIPEGDPEYAFGTSDVNGDGTDDFIVRVKTEGSKKGEASGYYAIYTPTPEGLMQASFIPAGSGEILVGDQGLIFTAEDRSEEAMTLRIYEDAMGDDTPARVVQQLTLTKVNDETGEALAEEYPEESLVLLNDGSIYRFRMDEFDLLMDYAAHEIERSDFFLFTGTEANDQGDAVPGEMNRNTVKDAVDFLQQSHPDLPLSMERLQKATSTKTFASLARPLTAGDFDRVE